MADRLENAKKAHVLHEIHPQFRSATPLQISNYWRQYARYPDTRLWHDDGIIRSHQMVPEVAGVFKLSKRNFLLASTLFAFTAGVIANELFFTGKNKITYDDEYDPNGWAKYQKKYKSKAADHLHPAEWAEED